MAQAAWAGSNANESECNDEPSGSADYHTEPEGSVLHAAIRRRGPVCANFFKCHRHGGTTQSAWAGSNANESECNDEPSGSVGYHT